jgi:hypothetical protein
MSSKEWFPEFPKETHGKKAILKKGENMDIKFLKRSFFQRLLGISATTKPASTRLLLRRVLSSKLL